MPLPYTTPPSRDDILALASDALAALPPRFAEPLRGLAILVDDIADDETLEEMRIDNAWELTGLYRGIPLTERSYADTPAVPDTIHLYREPILVEWVETGEDLPKLVASVLVHEIAHHFGWSDADIERVEADMTERGRAPPA